MTSDMIVREVAASEWDKLCAKFVDCNFEHSSPYVSAIAQRTGCISRYAVIESQNGLEGAAAIRIKSLPFVGRGIAYVSSGPICQLEYRDKGDVKKYVAIVAALLKQYRNNQGHLTAIRPPISTALLDQQELVTELRALGGLSTSLVRSYRTVLIDLQNDEELLRANLHGKWRNHLAKSFKSGINLEQGNSSDLWARFLKVFGEMQENKEFDAGLGPQFFSRLDQKEMGIRILIASIRGQDVGGVVLSNLGRYCVDLFAATNTAGRESRAGYFLRWMAMSLLRQEGYKYYDMGGVSETENPHGFEFKTRMGGKLIHSAGPFKFIPKGLSGIALDRVISTFSKFAKRV